METAQITSAIEEKLEDLEIILRHLSLPENHSTDDGEYVCSFLAQNGLDKLSKTQDLFKLLKPA